MGEGEVPIITMEVEAVVDTLVAAVVVEAVKVVAVVEVPSLRIPMVHFWQDSILSMER